MILRMRRLSIADPCAASWDQMEGTDRDRRCARCDRQVHDLSARSEIEASALLLVLGSGGLCVRFERGADGAVRHAPEARRAPPSPRAAAGLVAAAAIGVAACSPTASAPPPVLSVAPAPPPPFAVATASPDPPAVTPVALLEAVAQVLQQNPDIVKIAIQGHASRDEVNAERLGKARAASVVAALRALRVDPARLVAESYGLERPIADNATKDGRERNRRVEFKVLESKSCVLPGAAAP
jgi:hypothetical protein